MTGHSVALFLFSFAPPYQPNSVKWLHANNMHYHAHVSHKSKVSLTIELFDLKIKQNCMLVCYLWRNLITTVIFRSTQRAVLQNNCSTVGILLGKLIQFYVLLARWNTSAWRLFKNLLWNGHYLKFILELWKIFENIPKLWTLVKKRT